jgi:p25-alpha
MSDAQLRAVFSSFCSFGAGQSGSAEMDSAKFVKLSKESGLVDKKLTTTDLDLIFTKSKGGAGLKRLDYNTFTVALRHIADKKGLAYEDIAGQIVAAGGPSTGKLNCRVLPSAHASNKHVSQVWR